MKKVRVITAEEAALMVKDGDTVTTGGFVSCACPEGFHQSNIPHTLFFSLLIKSRFFVLCKFPTN